MRGVEHGRMTVKVAGEFVVSLVGMRVNRLWQFWQWMPVSMAMPRIVAELMRRPG